MNLLYCYFLFSASVFSIERLGQERMTFKDPFLGELRNAQIEFTLQPEFNILNQERDFRVIFWTNPFYFALKLPVYKGLAFSLGSFERLNQSFDIYHQEGMLDMYVQGRGGVEEIYLKFNQRTNFAEIFLSGSYLYGSSREVWNYTIGDYSNADTFLYNYQGRIVSGGVKLFFLSLFYETLGKLDRKMGDYDTTYNLPQVVGIGVIHSFSNLRCGLSFERAIWEGGNTVNRLKGNLVKGDLKISSGYNPWYIKGVREYFLDIGLERRFKTIGYFTFQLNNSVRFKESLREFAITPQLKLILLEIFGRRRK